MNDLAWSFTGMESAEAESPPSAREEPLLLVVDGGRLASPVAALLSQRGFRVARVAEPSAVLALLSARPAGLVVLVAADGRGESFDLCRRLAQRGYPPILMISAEDSAIDRILGLELGADDCVPADCDPRELVARVRTLLRRGARDAGVEAPVTSGYRFAGARLDVARRELHRVDGAVVSLSAGELMLLRVFIDHPHEVLGREQLSALAGHSAPQCSRAIDVQVSRLRRKLGRKPDGDEVVRTVYGAGYMMTASVTAA